MVLLLIGCFDGINTGAGGHYYSLLQTCKSLSVPHQIVVVGDFVPALYAGENVRFVEVAWRRLLTADLSAVMDLSAVTCVHAYDIDVALLASKIASELSVPLVNTKPGGPPIKPWSLGFKNQIVFHQFDHDYFRSRRWLKPRHLCQISNRVTAPEPMATPRPSPFEFAPDAAVRILRIGRISELYRQSFFQAIELFERLQADGRRAALAIVGKVQDQEVLKDIEQRLAGRDDCIVLTDERYTVKAAELLVYADVVVGTGRGFMEGLSHSKLMFFPVRGERMPCFMTPENYHEAFYHNFSERTPKSALADPLARYQDFLRLLDTGELGQYQAFTHAAFVRDHWLEEGVRKLEQFYQSQLAIETSWDFRGKLAHRGCLLLSKRISKSLQRYRSRWLGNDKRPTVAGQALAD